MLIEDGISLNGAIGTMYMDPFLKVSSSRDEIVAQIKVLSHIKNTSDPTNSFLVASKSSIRIGIASNLILIDIGEADLL